MLNFSPNQVRQSLSYLGEFALLSQSFRRSTRRGCLPAIPMRIRFKWLESHLPAKLIQFGDLLGKFPYLAEQHWLPASAACPHCGSSLSIEWFPGEGESPLCITCFDCGFLRALAVGNARPLPLS